MVRCADCGFLAMRNAETRVLCETEGGFRKTGNHPRMLTARFNVYEEVPICFKDARDFKEIGVVWGATDAEQRVAALNLEHDCKQWEDWRQGLSPKEHQEMLDRQKLIEWQADREDKDRQWRDDQRKSDHRWRALELLIIGVIGVLMAGAFTILGAFIERGSFP